MRVLITGGAGFIGSHLAEALLAQGHTVIAVDDFSTGSMENIASIIDHENFELVRESVRNVTTMTPIVDHCDLIFHLAAAVGVQLIVDDPVHTIETNIHGSEVMLDLANKFRRRILVASTSEVYGKNEKMPFNEDDDITFGSTKYTRWAYACSKMIDEFLALAYHDQFGLPTLVTRFFNTVGPRQTGQYGMVVPRFVQKALKNEVLPVYGTGQQSRCFCNVYDVVDALLKLVVCDEAYGQVINIGSTESITIEALADKIIEMTGSSSKKKSIGYEEAYGRPFDDMMARQPDLTRVKGLIDFEPTRTLDQTLAEVIEYEKARM